MTVRAFIFVLVAGMLAGCIGMGGVDPRLEQTAFDDYRLDSGDRLRIVVFRQNDLSGEYTVDGNGRIALPLIDSVSARGLTTEQLTQRLEEHLGRTLLRNPSVSIEIQAFRPFFVLGEVNQPGQFPYVSGMTVKTAAAIAGGFTYRASTSQVIITRRAGGQVIEGPARLNTPVMPGDTIFVRERIF